MKNDFKPYNYSSRKRRLRNDLVLIHKILYNHIDLKAIQLFKFSSRPVLRRLSISLLHQTGRTRRTRNMFACMVVNNWNRLTLSLTEQRKFKKTIRLICSLINFSHYSIFAPIWPFLGTYTFGHARVAQTKPNLPVDVSGFSDEHGLNESGKPIHDDVILGVSSKVQKNRI